MGSARIEVLSSDEVDAIHAASLDVLEHVGVIVREPRATNLLLEAGATRGTAEDQVLIPESLVKETLSKVRRRWTWHAREARHSIEVGDGGRTRLGPGSACTKVLDYETGQPRPPTVRDAVDLVRLMDALEFVDVNFTPVSLSGPEGTTSYDEVSTTVRDLENTSKPLIGPSFNGAMARDALEIAAILAGGKEALRKRPMLAGYCDPVSPLIHDRPMTEIVIEYAALGQPVFLTCLDLAGASAPPTLAGTLVQQNAEILSGAAIATLVNKDAPLIYGCVSGVLDMRAGNAALGGPEFGLLSIAAAQLAHRYGFPCTTGGQSDSKTHDAQASLEKGMTLLASVLAGADFVDLFFGSYDGFGTTSAEQIVVDHDIAAYAFRYRGGIEVSDETLAVDLLRDVGAGGNFLRSKKALEYTMARVKREYAFPAVLDRRGATSTTLTGPSLLQRAHERVRAILAEHEPAPLDPGLRKELHAALGGLRKRMARAAAT